MSGNYSRNKGRRIEYLVRNYFRRLGYDADRVPLSGASQGFKGDVRVSIPNIGRTFTVEVKGRKNYFKNIYKYLVRRRQAFLEIDGQLVALSTDFEDLQLPKSYISVASTDDKAFRQLLKIKVLMETCDFLVIKDDNQPLVFIQYAK